MNQDYPYTQTTQEFFLGLLAGYRVEDNTLKSVFAKRGIMWDGTPAMMEHEASQLALADFYCIIARMPSGSSSVEDADGGWRHRESTGAMGVSDKKRLISLANEIYRTYGEPEVKSAIRIINL